MIKKIKRNILRIINDMLEKHDKEMFDRIVFECVKEAFSKYDVRKTTEIKHWDNDLVVVYITTYKENGKKTITQKEAFNFKDLAQLILSTKGFVEEIREKFELGAD